MYEMQQLAAAAAAANGYFKDIRAMPNKLQTNNLYTRALYYNQCEYP